MSNALKNTSNVAFESVRFIVIIVAVFEFQRAYEALLPAVSWMKFVILVFVGTVAGLLYYAAFYVFYLGFLFAVNKNKGDEKW